MTGRFFKCSVSLFRTHSNNYIEVNLSNFVRITLKWHIRVVLLNKNKCCSQSTQRYIQKKKLILHISATTIGQLKA